MAAADKSLMALEIDDANKDGFVDKEEFMLSTKDALVGEGVDDHEFRKAVYRYVENLYEICDLDFDGVLNPAEVEYGQHLAATASLEPSFTGGGLRYNVQEYDFGAAAAQRFFDAVDKDSDGSIDEREYGQLVCDAFAEFGVGAESCANGPVRTLTGHLFSKADVSDDGVLGIREAQYAGILLNAQVVQEVVGLMYRDLDLNRDGLIKRREVVVAKGIVGADDKADVLGALLEVFDEFDRDHDGAFNISEAMAYATLALNSRPGSAGA